MSSDYIAQMQFRLHVKTNEEIKYRNEINFLKEQCIFAVYCKTSKNNQLQNIQTDTSISKLNLIQKCGSNIVEQRKKRVKLLKPVNEHRTTQFDCVQTERILHSHIKIAHSLLTVIYILYIQM